MDIGFEFDVDIAEKSNLSVQWTEKPVESGATISDYGVLMPRTYEVSGVVTAWPWTGYDEQRVIKAQSALEDIAKAKQPITLVSRWITQEIVIENVTMGYKATDGDHQELSVTCRTINIPKKKSVQIPASQLKESVKKRAAPKGKGGKGNSGQPGDKADKAFNDLKTQIPWIS